MRPWEKRPNKHIKHGIKHGYTLWLFGWLLYGAFTLWFRTKNVVKEVEASWKHTVLQKNAT